jgi:hypothetical protein
MGKRDVAPAAADEGDGDGPARKVEHHQKQLDRHSRDRALGPRLQQAAQRHELAPSSVVFGVLAEALQCEGTHAQGREVFVEGGEEPSRAVVPVPLGGRDVDGLLRVAQRVLETILLFVDGGAGVE